jgi:hypothetical protein
MKPSGGGEFAALIFKICATNVGSFGIQFSITRRKFKPLAHLSIAGKCHLKPSPLTGAFASQPSATTDDAMSNGSVVHGSR